MHGNGINRFLEILLPLPRYSNKITIKRFTVYRNEDQLLHELFAEMPHVRLLHRELKLL